MVLKVALIHNIITPYRNVLFDELSEKNDIDLHVFYCSRSHQRRNWSIQKPLNHEHTILPGISFDKVGIRYHINPTIIVNLLADDFDIVIIGGCMNFTMKLGYCISKVDIDGTILWTERFCKVQSPTGKIINPLTRKMAYHADTVIVPTTKAREFQKERGIPTDQIVIAPNIIDDEPYWSNENNNECVRLLFVGQLIDRKGIPQLLDAYEKANNDNIELILVGDGPMRNAYEDMVHERGLNVTFTGWVSEQKKRQYFANADCFILPSIKDLSPLVLNEAMASRLPIISTEGVGNAQDMIIEGGNGWIVSPGDSDELAKALVHMFSHRDKLTQMGARSHRIMKERFSKEYSTEKFITAIEKSVR